MILRLKDVLSMLSSARLKKRSERTVKKSKDQKERQPRSTILSMVLSSSRGHDSSGESSIIVVAYVKTGVLPLDVVSVSDSRARR